MLTEIIYIYNVSFCHTYIHAYINVYGSALSVSVIDIGNVIGNPN